VIFGSMIRDQGDDQFLTGPSSVKLGVSKSSRKATLISELLTRSLGFCYLNDFDFSQIFIGDGGSSLYAIDLRNGGVLHGYKGGII